MKFVVPGRAGEEGSRHRRALFMRLLQEAPVFLVILIVVVVERRLFR